MISIIIVTSKIRYLGTVRSLQPKTKQVLYVNMENMDFLPPQPRFRARDLYTPYSPNDVFFFQMHYTSLTRLHYDNKKLRERWRVVDVERENNKPFVLVLTSTTTVWVNELPPVSPSPLPPLTSPDSPPALSKYSR